MKFDSTVRGPKHSVKIGMTPVLTDAEARMLIDNIDIESLVGLRDRALIGVRVYSFGRVSAVAEMSVGDDYTQGKRSGIRSHEKGGKYNVVPAHHLAQDDLDFYITAAGIADDRKSPLFRSSGRGQQTNTLLSKGISRWTAVTLRLQLELQDTSQLGRPNSTIAPIRNSHSMKSSDS